MKSKFKVGDKVIWTSHAGSSVKTKEGVIVDVVEASEDPFYSNQVQYNLGLYGARNKHGMGCDRNHESYLVLVPGEGKKQPSLYWPLVSRLTKTGRNVRVLKGR